MLFRDINTKAKGVALGRRSSPRIKQKKSLGQVFLNTDWPVERVVQRLKTWQVKRVLEIGPGAGILTKALLRSGLKVTAVERDDRFVERLENYRQTFAEDQQERFEIVGEDILKFDLRSWIDRDGDVIAVVGNIPYNISSGIVMWVLPHLESLVGVFFLTQLEFAARLAGRPSTKAYGSLSVFAQLRSDVSLDCKVDRNCFTPVPKVDSALVSLRKKKDKLDDELLQKVENITRTAFSQRRKTLKNALSTFLTEESVASCPVDLSRRPDAIRPEEYVDLAKVLLS